MRTLRSLPIIRLDRELDLDFWDQIRLLRPNQKITKNKRINAGNTPEFIKQLQKTLSDPWKTWAVHWKYNIETDLIVNGIINLLHL